MRMRAMPRIPSMNWSRPTPGGPSVALLEFTACPGPLLHLASVFDQAIRPHRHAVVVGDGHPADLVVRAVEAGNATGHALHPLAHHVLRGVEGLAEEQEGLRVLSIAAGHSSEDQPGAVV